MVDMWCGGLGGVRKIPFTYKYTLLEFLSWLCNLVLNNEESSLKSIVRRSVRSIPVFILVMKCVFMYVQDWLVRLSSIKLQLFFILPRQHYIESVFNS